jgi:hypothetical protein
MIERRILVCLAAGAFLFGGVWLNTAVAELQKKGSVIGVVTAKDKNWIEVKADGEEKPRRYTPAWIGGNAGGLDKNILKAIADTPLNARVKLDWGADERPRVLKIEVIKKDSDKKDGDKK